MDDELARFILDAPCVSLKWVAGYAKSVDWINSTAFDWCFWNEFFSWHAETVARQIEGTADFIKRNLDDLRKNLSFRLYRRKGGTVVQVL